MNLVKSAFFFLAGGLVVAFMAVAFMSSPAQAGKTKVLGNVVPQNLPAPPAGSCSGGDACYNLPTDKFGKFALKESKKAGSGGTEMQLKLKGVDCPDVDVGGDAGKCNDENHVLELNTNFAGLPTTAGVLYDLVKGKSAFQATGKNKVTGAELFGALVGFVQGQFLGVGVLRARGPGSNPVDCLTVPITGANPGCNDGEIYGISGIRVSDEPGTEPPPCTTDADCSLNQDCSAGNCIAEACTQDSDCDEFGNGEVACNETTMTCCLFNLDTDPNCDVD